MICSSFDPLTLQQALNFYIDNLNYVPLVCPSVVDLDVLYETIPKDRVPTPHLNKYYVGSAEQSFLQLLKDGFIPKENCRYLLISPCKRDEEKHDDTHFDIFFKIELITIDKSVSLIDDALSCFEYLTKDKNKKICTSFDINTNIFDIEINDIEVGSYGSRIYNNIKYYYGTGIALPRFNYALSLT